MKVIKSMTTLARNVARTGEMRNIYIFAAKPEKKKPLGRPRRIWENSIKINPKQIGYLSVDWIQSAQDMDQRWALVNTVINLWVR
jgi:hypothetical protein